MIEWQPLPELPTQVELQPQSPPFYKAINENQKAWRETKHSIMGSHEMPHVSERIEKNMIRLFSEYIVPAYPRVILARTVLQTTSSPYETPFYRYGSEYGEFRFPENVKPEDQGYYYKGIYALNEWATNYATRYYFKHTSKTPLTKPLRQLYAQATDGIVGKAHYHQAYKNMGEVKKAAQATNTSFDDH